jgi:hypothetical protein
MNLKLRSTTEQMPALGLLMITTIVDGRSPFTQCPAVITVYNNANKNCQGVLEQCACCDSVLINLFHFHFLGKIFYISTDLIDILGMYVVS